MKTNEFFGFPPAPESSGPSPRSFAGSCRALFALIITSAFLMAAGLPAAICIQCPDNLVLGTGPGQCAAVAHYAVTATDSCAAPITVDIYRRFQIGNGGAPFSELVGSLTTSAVSFGANTGFGWHPLGLAEFGANMNGVLNVGAAGTYTFTLNSDDGSMLYIDGNLVINNGDPSGDRPDQIPYAKSGTVALTAGSHTFNVQFFSCCGGPSGVDLILPAGVAYGDAGPLVNVAVYQGFQIANGGAPYSSLSTTFRATGVSFGAGTGFNWHPGALAEFGAEFAGCLNVAAAGSYTFTLNSDDGSMLYIDGALVINNGDPSSERTNQAPYAKSGTVTLAAGRHAFTVQYFSCCGGPSGVDLILPPGVIYAACSLGVVTDPPSGSTFPLGTTTVNCTASDTAGNTNSCSFTVTVLDLTPPVINCPTNLVVATDPGQCSAVVNYAPLATDNCGQLLTVNVYRRFQIGNGGAPFSDLVGSFPASGVSFGAGTTFNWHPYGLAEFGAEVLGMITVRAEGDYTFTLNSDDGSMLYLDGALVINNGDPSSDRPDRVPFAKSATVHLTAGRHALLVQFFSCCGGPSGVDLVLPDGVSYGSGGALVKATVYRGFQIGNGGAPYTDPVRSFTATGVSFGSGTGFNWRPLGLTDFGADLSGCLDVLATGTYTFALSSEDGSMLYIDGQLVIDNGDPSSDRVGDQVYTKSGTVTLTAGSHSFNVQFFACCTGPVGVDLLLPDGVAYGNCGPQVQIDLYKGFQIGDGGSPYHTPAGTLTAPSVAFGAGTGFNWHPLGLAEFGADMSGYLDVLVEGDYTFTLNSDDGSMLYIAGSLVINNGDPSGDRPDQIPYAKSGTKHLTAGRHAFHLEFFSCCGGPSGVDLILPAGVSYGTADPLVDVTVYRGFNIGNGGAPFSDLAGSFSSSGVSFGAGTGFNWHPLGLAEFGAEITGCLSVRAAGNYTFTLNSDDGSLLYIDGRLVINNGDPSGDRPDQIPYAKSATIALRPGLHVFKVEFFSCCGGPSGVDLVLPLGVAYAPRGVVVLTDPPSGTALPKGDTIVNCTALDAAGNASSCSFTVTVVDREAPLATARPYGPEGGDSKGVKYGKNPSENLPANGFYQLLGRDNCDTPPLCFIADSVTGFVAGPFSDDELVKITQAPGRVPSVEAAPAPLAAHVYVRGDALIYAVDAAGNITPRSLWYNLTRPQP